VTYSSADFTDTIIEVLGVDVPEKSHDSPSDQADLALAKIDRLQQADDFLAAFLAPSALDGKEEDETEAQWLDRLSDRLAELTRQAGAIVAHPLPPPAFGAPLCRQTRRQSKPALQRP
jgi:hypothetical protein